MKDESECRKNTLCDFEVSRDLPDAQIEVCINCGKKVVYYKVENRIDNAKYLRDHIRNTVQPFGRTGKLFRQIYGEGPTKKLLANMRGKKSKKEIQKEWEDMRREIREQARKNRIYL